jgi:hypothetical protein
MGFSQVHQKEEAAKLRNFLVQNKLSAEEITEYAWKWDRQGVLSNVTKKGYLRSNVQRMLDGGGMWTRNRNFVWKIAYMILEDRVKPLIPPEMGGLPPVEKTRTMRVGTHLMELPEPKDSRPHSYPGQMPCPTCGQLANVVLNADHTWEIEKEDR